MAGSGKNGSILGWCFIILGIGPYGPESQRFVFFYPQGKAFIIIVSFVVAVTYGGGFFFAI